MTWGDLAQQRATASTPILRFRTLHRDTIQGHHAWFRKVEGEKASSHKTGDLCIKPSRPPLGGALMKMKEAKTERGAARSK